MCQNKPLLFYVEPHDTDQPLLPEQESGPSDESGPSHESRKASEVITCQTSTTLSRNTPRKKKQKKVIHAQLKNINRMKKALEKKKAGKKERSLEEALGELPENLAHFIRMQLNLHRKKAKGRRYSPQMKSIAVSLYIMPVGKPTGCYPNYSFCPQKHHFANTSPKYQQLQEFLRVH